MQTFLPYPDFVLTAKVLDDKRLNKQILEAYQILKTISLGSSARGWRNHPAVRMWRGYEDDLIVYALLMCRERESRGRLKHACMDRIVEFWAVFRPRGTRPHWLGNPEFHRSHQSNLIRKMPKHYSPYFPDVPPDLPYVWPSGENRNV